MCACMCACVCASILVYVCVCHNLDVSPLVFCACVPLWQPCLRFKPFICWRHFVAPHAAHSNTHTHTRKHTLAHTHTYAYTFACWQKTSLSGFAFSAPHLFYVFIALFACVLFSARYLLCTHKQRDTHTHWESRVLWVPFWHIPEPCFCPCFLLPPHLLRFLLHSESDSFWHWICPRHFGAGKLNTGILVRL